MCFVVQLPQLLDNYLLISRFILTCCAVDAYPVGLPVKLSGSRGQYYYDSGAVISLWQRGQNLQALVNGSEVKPYRVAMDFNQDNLENVSCSCPYDYEGWCKHIVAVLLTCSRQPELIIKKASLEELLTPIDESKLRKLLNHLVAKHPEIIETIDKFLLPATPVNKAGGKITINVKAYRNTVRNELRQSLRAIEEDYYEEDPISDEIYALVDEAQDYYQKGEPDNAIFRRDNRDLRVHNSHRL